MSALLLLSPLLLAYVAAPLCRRLAWRLSLVDVPRSDRFSQAVVPKLGGLVVLVGAAGALVGAMETPVVRWLALGWFLAFCVGLVDDRRPLRPRVKFVLQLIASIATVWPLVASGVGAAWSGVPAWALAALGVFWVTTFQNAVNFLDNMDGIATGVAAIALGGLAFLLAASGAHEFAVVLALACAGFLPWNVSPARLYLGDAGSLSLGHAVGATSFLAALGCAEWGHAVAVLPIVSIPLIDLTFVTWRRLAEGRSPAQGGRDHTTHRLYQRLSSVPRTRNWFWASGTVLAVGGVLLSRTAVLSPWVPIIALVGIAGGLMAWFATLPTPDATAEQN